MSRVGKKPINVPSGVTVTINGTDVTVKGPKGTLKSTFSEDIKIINENNIITLERTSEMINVVAMHGTTRALLANMITGVSEGFSKTLDLVGVGYRVAAKGNGVTLALGYSHPIEIDPVAGITFKVEGQNKVTIEGIDKATVGQVAANIRSKRPPEPYKGKGVKYSTEVVRRKEGKKA